MRSLIIFTVTVKFKRKFHEKFAHKKPFNLKHVYLYILIVKLRVLKSLRADIHISTFIFMRLLNI